MRRLVVTLFAVAATAGAVLFVVLQAWPGLPRERWLDLYLLFLGALFMFGFVQATRAADSDAESVFERVLRRHAPRPERPASLAKLEREVALSAVTAFDFHARLRPTLREIAAYKLANRGLTLDSGSPDARAVLGEDLWQLLRADRRPPDDRHAPGLPLDRLRALLDDLDKI